MENITRTQNIESFLIHHYKYNFRNRIWHDDTQENSSSENIDLDSSNLPEVEKSQNTKGDDFGIHDRPKSLIYVE